MCYSDNNCNQIQKQGFPQKTFLNLLSEILELQQQRCQAYLANVWNRVAVGNMNKMFL